MTFSRIATGDALDRAEAAPQRVGPLPASPARPTGGSGTTRRTGRSAWRPRPRSTLIGCSESLTRCGGCFARTAPVGSCSATLTCASASP